MPFPKKRFLLPRHLREAESAPLADRHILYPAKVNYIVEASAPPVQEDRNFLKIKGGAGTGPGTG